MYRLISLLLIAVLHVSSILAQTQDDDVLKKKRYGGGGVAVPTLGPHCQADSKGSSVASESCTLTSVPASSLITCHGNNSSTGATVSAVSDGTNGVYHAILSAGNPADIEPTFQFAFFGAAAGTYSVTVYFDQTSANSVMACETFSNILTSNSVDSAVTQAKAVTTNTANPTAGSTLTPTNNNTVIMATLGTGANTPTAGSNMTLIDSSGSCGVSSNSCLYPGYDIQGSKAPINCPYILSSDTWADLCVGYLPSSAAAGVTPFSGAIVALTGVSSGTTISASNLATGTSTVFPGGWGTVGTISAVYDNTSGFGGALTSKYINGVSYLPTGAMTIKHVGNVAERWNYTFNALSVTGHATFGLFWKTDYVTDSNNDACDMVQIGDAAGAGDGITLQYFYNSGLFMRMERTPTTTVSSGVATPTNTWYLTTVNINLTNSGTHVATTYNATTGAVIGTDSVTVSGSGSNLTNQVIVSFGNQGSCSDTNHIWYGPAFMSPIAIDYPVQP